MEVGLSNRASGWIWIYVKCVHNVFWQTNQNEDYELKEVTLDEYVPIQELFTTP